MHEVAHQSPMEVEDIPDQGWYQSEPAAVAEVLPAVGPIIYPLADPWAGRRVVLAVKRALDILGSITGLVCLSPILLLAALAIGLDSHGPVIFRQERMGLRNKEFTLYKFRTMVTDAEKDGPKWADVEDERVTRVGRFLRRTRLDEVPQLWNVLRGEMSLVGPRPERKYFIRQFVKEYPRFAWRTLVKPGITGWAQVNGGYDLGPTEKLEFDLTYIEHFSMAMDLRILGRTMGVVLFGKGAR